MKRCEMIRKTEANAWFNTCIKFKSSIFNQRICLDQHLSIVPLLLQSISLESQYRMSANKIEIKRMKRI